MRFCARSSAKQEQRTDYGRSMLSIVTARFIIIVLLCLPASSFGSEPNCTLKIIRDSVASSWQTSSFEQACFANSGEVGEATFLHTNKQTDDGYIWFVVQLKQVTYVTEITIKNRETKTGENEADLSSRASNIDVYSSNLEHYNFGTERCTAATISSQFTSSKADWTLCGRTPSLSDIRSEQPLHVKCNQVHEVRFILLRKQIDNSQSEDRRFMGFIDMWITTVSVSIEIAPGTSQSGANVTIKCVTACCADGCDVKVCRPRGECRRSSINLTLRPSDSGYFTCSTGGKVLSRRFLSVQYPPSMVELSPTGGISCGDTTSVDATFQVVSSAAEPGPRHSCAAQDSAGRQRPMSELKPPDFESGDRVVSLWLCANCSDAIGLQVNCSANNRVGGATAVWNCEPAADILIEFGKAASRNLGLEIEFTVISTESSPTPEHQCNASTAKAQKLKAIQWNSHSARGQQGRLKTEWTVLLPLSWKQAELIVECTAGHRFAWSKRQGAVWRHSSQQKQPKFGLMWLLGLCGSAVLVLIAVGTSVTCYCKLKRPLALAAQQISLSQAPYSDPDAGRTDGNAQSENKYVDLIEMDDPYDGILRVD